MELLRNIINNQPDGVTGIDSVGMGVGGGKNDDLGKQHRYRTFIHMHLITPLKGKSKFFLGETNLTIKKGQINFEQILDRFGETSSNISLKGLTSRSL